MKLFFSLLSFIIFACGTHNPGRQIEFKKFLLLEYEYNRAEKFHEAEQFDSAIFFYKRTAISINSNYASNISIARCFAEINQLDSAMHYASISFRQGFPWEYISSDSVLFRPIWNRLKKYYEGDNEKYLHTIDTILINELRVMYRNDQEYRKVSSGRARELRDSVDQHNIKRLREITSKVGWPERSVQGFGVIVDPAVFVIHSDEESNLYFLKIAKSSARSNQSSWFSPRSIMYNLLWRFSYEGYNKLRDVNPRKGVFEDDDSYFQLKSLAQFTIDNNSFITLHAHKSDAIDFTKHYTKYLSQIRDFLIANGVDKSRISVDDNLLKEGKDKFGTYLFSYSIEK